MGFRIEATQAHIFAGVATIILSISSGETYAQREAEILGGGAVPCGEYTEYRKHNSNILNSTFQSWANGYISGYNQFSSNEQVQEAPSPQVILAYLDNYCQSNPLAPVKYAIDILIMELGGKGTVQIQ
jgi:hypothetical protein